jgi:hypothetical protein
LRLLLSDFSQAIVLESWESWQAYKTDCRQPNSFLRWAVLYLSFVASSVQTVLSWWTKQIALASVWRFYLMLRLNYPKSFPPDTAIVPGHYLRKRGKKTYFKCPECMNPWIWVLVTGSCCLKSSGLLYGVGFGPMGWKSFLDFKTSNHLGYFEICNLGFSICLSSIYADACAKLSQHATEFRTNSLFQ